MQAADEDPHELLWDLLDRGGQEEVVWRRSQGFFNFADYAEMDEVDAEYHRLFEGVVDDLTAAMGEPRFRGPRGKGGFPSWSPALHIALWAEGDRAAYVAVVHDGRDDPFELRIGVR